MFTKLERSYGNLYNVLNKLRQENRLESNTVFTAMEGHKYRSCHTVTGDEFRFMLIGRAVNSWTEYKCVDEGRDSFIAASMRNLRNEENALDPDCKNEHRGKDRFEWIKTNKNTAVNAYRPNIDNMNFELDKPYRVSASALWSYPKEVWSRLYGKTQNWEERWFENIVWSNLYKIAPEKGKNPDEDDQLIQREACIELLNEEIQYFKPTHILVVSGYDWFECFNCSGFQVTDLGVRNVSNGKEKNSVFVEGIGYYNFSEGTKAKVVVTCRPEYRSKDGYVDEIINGFRDISD